MRIRRVTDLRTGLPHPRRDSHGRFISRKKAAHTVRFWERMLDDESKIRRTRSRVCGWRSWVFVITRMHIW